MAEAVSELVAKLGIDVDESAFEKAFEALEHLKLGFGAIAGIAAAVGGALVAMVHSVAETAIEMDRAAQRAGVGRDAFQELAYAADQSGVSAETLQHSLILLSRTASGAADGSKELGFVYRRLGVSLRDSHGAIKPTDELLGDLAE